MFCLENELIICMNNRDRKRAKEVYSQIISKYETGNMNSKSCLRNMKNYLISLNSIIYMNHCNYTICKKSFFKIRNKFMEEIERNNSFRDLINIGQEIINFYMNSVDDIGIMTKNPIINNALDYINNNLGEDLTLEKVSKSIHVSKSYLSHLFSRCTGHSFSHYVSRTKIKRSKELLVNTNYSLMRIALECGFNSQSYFCNVFKKFEGITPKQYRIFYHKYNIIKPL